jgi:hypothetical protein
MGGSKECIARRGLRRAALTVAVVVWIASALTSQAHAGDLGPPPATDAPTPSPSSAAPAAEPIDLGQVPGIGPAIVEAKPPPPPRFGSQGQWTISGGAGVSAYSYSLSQSSAAGTVVNIAPGFGYFVARNVWIGVSLGGNHGDARGYGADGTLVRTRTDGVSGSLALGLNVPFARVFSFFPTLAIGYEWIHRLADAPNGSTTVANPYVSNDTSLSGPYVSIFAPLLVHPVPHFYLGFGPTFFHEFGAASSPDAPNVGGQRTSAGLAFTVGVHWGGGAPGRDESDPSAPPDDNEAFGERGQIVLGNNLVANLNWLAYAGTGASSFTGAVGGSVDYFLASHFFFGAFASESYGLGKGAATANVAAARSSHNTVYFGPRLGADVPLGRWLSVEAIGSLEFGIENYDETSGQTENKYSGSIAAIDLFAPLLVHPAQHVFFGLGPFIYYEYSHSISYPGAPSFQNTETEYGLSSVIGGWL